MKKPILPPFAGLLFFFLITSLNTTKAAVIDTIPPTALCHETYSVFLNSNGIASATAPEFDNGSFDDSSSVHFKVRRFYTNDCYPSNAFDDQTAFCCQETAGDHLLILRVYDVPVPPGMVGVNDFAGHYSDCSVQVTVVDSLKPSCEIQDTVVVSCKTFNPDLSVYGQATSEDNCCVDGISESVDYSAFDSVCIKGMIRRTFTAADCNGNTTECQQILSIDYDNTYYVRFPNDLVINYCDGQENYGAPLVSGENCEQVEMHYVQTVNNFGLFSCQRVLRSWTIYDGCVYDNDLPCTDIPNPQPHPSSDYFNPENFFGPVISPQGTLFPWNPTTEFVSWSDTVATPYSTFWDPNSNCYTYLQVINLNDNAKPEIVHCPPGPVVKCGNTDNDPLLWNDPEFWNAINSTNDLCEASVLFTITATDSCVGPDVHFSFDLRLDLNGDGFRETHISNHTDDPGVVSYNGGTAFDQRPVDFEDKYRFAFDVIDSSNYRTLTLRWDNINNPADLTDNVLQGVLPRLPYGSHQIQMAATDNCGNHKTCYYDFEIKDCKAPDIVCNSTITVQIQPQGMVRIYPEDMMESVHDNYYPEDSLEFAIIKTFQNLGGFPLGQDGNPMGSVVFGCNDLGPQAIQLWARDPDGNAGYCDGYLIIKDDVGNCQLDPALVAGQIYTENQDGVEEVDIKMVLSYPQFGPFEFMESTDQYGDYQFSNIFPEADVFLTPSKTDNPMNGVSTYDLILINSHVLSLTPLTSPYKIIAADINRSKSVTTFDIVELRKLILGIYSDFPNNTSWRFVDKNFVFTDPSNPFVDQFPETRQFYFSSSIDPQSDFWGIKVGDLNNTAMSNIQQSSEERNQRFWELKTEDRSISKGALITVELIPAEPTIGFQFTLEFEGLSIQDVYASQELTSQHFAVFEDAMTISFDGNLSKPLTLQFRAHKDGMLSDFLRISSRITPAEAYSEYGELMAVALRFDGQAPYAEPFTVYPNAPNPWTNETQLAFYLPKSEEVEITVFDELGRLVYRQKREFEKGRQFIVVGDKQIPSAGVYYYEIRTATDVAGGKMIRL